MPFAPRSANPPRASPLVACSRFLPRLWALVLCSVWQRRTASDLASTSLEALREPPVFPTHLVLLTTVENRNRLSRTLSLSRLGGSFRFRMGRGDSPWVFPSPSLRVKDCVVGRGVRVVIPSPWITTGSEPEPEFPP